MALTPEDLIFVERMIKEQIAIIAKRIPPKFGFVLMVYEDKGVNADCWCSYAMSGSPEAAKSIMTSVLENMQHAPPIIDPIRGNMIKFPGQGGS